MLTRHASKRAQQRSLPPLIEEWLFRYGEAQHQGGGTEILYFSKRSYKRLRHHVGLQPIRKLQQYLDAYLIVSDGRIVTMGHRHKRIIRG
jgi:hypothetical protein